MKIFMISPVRNIDEAYFERIKHEVTYLENQGHTVYWPARNTNQDAGSWAVCDQNRKALRAADMVYVIWDGKSEGVLFDLGMAFAMKKKVRSVIGMFPRNTYTKSFPNLVYTWEEMK